MSILRACRTRTAGVCERAAGSLESAADSIRSAGDQSATAISDFADDAGGKLDYTASQVRKFGSGFSNFNNIVTRHPMASIMLAAAAGLIAGFSWHRRPA